jgi:DnaJ-class molecular chaperone
MSTNSNNSKDETYYDILNIKKNASFMDIRNAYDKLSVKWNPKYNNKMGTNRRFMDINNAYQVLITSEIRKNYNKCLKNGTKFNFTFRDPFDIFDEYLNMKKSIENNISKNLNDILCKIVPVIKHPPKFPDVIIDRQLIFINEKPFEKITEQSVDGIKYITYVHSNGLRQRVMDNEDMILVIDKGLKN